MKRKQKTEDTVEKKEKALSFFDFLTSINAGPRGVNLMSECFAEPGEGVLTDSNDKAYVPFMVNRGLSYFPDTILYANAMNERAALPAKMQYDFLRNGIRPSKRFSKWAKRSDDSADVQLIMDKYEYSSEKARNVLKMFSTAALEELRIERDTGGIGKKKK